jgi:sugar phosphate isomerase/epimerase
MINGHKIGFMSSGSLSRMSAAEVCAKLKTIGYDSVEWTLDFACPHKHSIAELRELVRITAESGLAISEIVVQQDLVLTDTDERMANIQYVKDCIHVYSELGISTVNLFTGPVPWNRHPLKVGAGIKEGDAWQMVLNAFDEFVPLAESSGLQLALENVWGMLCHDFYTARHLIDYYHSPNLGVNFDPSHDILAGNFDIGWIMRQWGQNQIKHIHIKDAAGVQTDGQFVFPLPGEGYVDWKDLQTTAKSIGYNGFMSVEFESFRYLKYILNGDMEQAARISYENLTKLFA